MRLNSKIRKNSQEKKPPTPPNSPGRQRVMQRSDGIQPEQISISYLLLNLRNIEAGVKRPTRAFVRRLVELGSNAAPAASRRLEKLSLEYLPPREGTVQRRFKKSELDFIVSGHCEAVDLTLMSEVRLAMGTGCSDTLSYACTERQLFPVKLIDALSLTTFLARVVVAARIAQRITGCPASLLIADAWMLAPCRLPLGDPDPANDWFRTGESFTSVEASFLDRANLLGRDPRFRGALRSAITRQLDSYVEQLKICKIWNAEGANKRLDLITENDLFECDGMPISDEA